MHMRMGFRNNLMKKTIVKTSFLVFLTLLFQTVCSAQQTELKKDIVLDEKQKTSVVENLSKLIDENYVFPDVAKRIGDSVKKKLQDRKYDNVTSSVEFAKILTEDIRSINNDLHFQISFSYEPIPESGAVTLTPREIKKAREETRLIQASLNYGFQKLERLRGNIGYMEISEFDNAEFAGDTLAAAMNFLHDTNALIIDLRDNDGGRPDMVALLSSYFFEGGSTQLTGIYSRAQNKVFESWTAPYVAGKKYLDKDVYILTSNLTVSAGEGFTYNMKVLKRAIIVGETTTGAANPGRDFRVNEHFSVFIPTGRAINPVTNTNWEGVGIKPDIEVPASKALTVAHIKALEKTLEGSSDETYKQNIKSIISELKSQQK